MSQYTDPSTSICVCTRNRPDELRKCLLSIARSTIPVDQIIVSDDSTDDRTYQIVSSEFVNVRYTKGPRKGLAANRNHAVSRVCSDHVLFLDDDARLGSSFLESVYAWLDQSEDPRRTIVTGLEVKYANGEQVLVYPRDQNFLGFQRVVYRNGEAINTIVINSTLFPRALFDELCFDELLIYGSEEVDLATRARARGYDILLCESAVNEHYPSEVNRDYYRPFTDASRIYVTYKRYAVTEKKPIKGVVYLVAAIAHLFLSKVKRRGIAGALEALRSIKTSFGYLRNLIRSSKNSLR